MKAFIVLAALLCAFFSTSAQNQPKEQIAQQTGETVLITATDKVLAACFTQFELFENSNPHSFELWTDQENAYYLTAKGSAEGKAMILKVNLEKRAGGYFIPLDPRGESCSGVNCSSCVFNKKGGGCSCATLGSPFDTTPSYCNHTITKP